MPGTYLNLDPTRTGLLRAKWQKDASDREKQFRRWLAVFVLSLWANPPDDFLTAFNAEYIRLFLSPGSGLFRYWFSDYIAQAYRQALQAAYLRLTPAKQQGGKASFVTLVGGLATAEAKRLEQALKTYQSFEATGAQAASAILNLISTAKAQGRPPAEVVREAQAYVGTTLANRVLKNINTTVVGAYAEGSLDGYENLGVKEVGADVEFVTVAGRGASQERMKKLKVCPKCRALAGLVFTIQAARGKIPVHPLCRCGWLPVA